MQKTFLFCSNAYLAVIILPLLYLASITNTPFDSAEIILFLNGTFFKSIFVSGEYSLIIHPPFFTICLNSSSFSSGYILLNPHPITAIVFPFSFIAFSCAIVSIPLANPLIIVIPLFDISFENSLA